MNSQISKFLNQGLSCLLLFLVLSSCQREVIYEVNEQEIQPHYAVKSKQKSSEQFIAVLYANLFQKALSPNELFEISTLIQSVGDKEVAHEVIISNFMNRAGVKIPTDEEMRGNIDKFIKDTYERFLVREPSEAELAYFRNFIESNPDLSAEMVYFSFALSNEYLFY